MQRTSDHIWISFGSDDGHLLHPATVWSSDADGALCRFDGVPDPSDLVPGPTGDGQAVVYFHGPGGFCQQPATIVRTETNGAPALRLVPTGVAATAEERVLERFSVEAFGVSVVVGEDDVCPLIDVSAIGMGIHSYARYRMGRVLRVAFESPEDASVHAGYCRVRSLKGDGAGGRYGLLALDGAEGGTLRTGLRDLIAWVRRSELRRMPRAS